MTGQTALEMIVDAGEIALAQEARDRFLLDEHTFDQSEIVSNGLVVIPVESMGFLDLDVEYLIRRSLETLGESELLALLADSKWESASLPRAVKFKATSEGFRAFAWKCGFQNYFALAPKKKLMFLFSVHDYVLVAGSPNDLLMFWPGGLYRCFARFRAFVQASTHLTGTEREFFIRLSRMYEENVKPPWEITQGQAD